MFTQLTLKNFRGFKEIHLERLGRVNLIVGRNDSGKTSLLEGIALLSSPTQLFQNLPTLLRPHSGDPNKRYFRWIIRDQGAQTEARLDGDWADNESVTPRSFAVRHSSQDSRPLQNFPPSWNPIFNMGNLMALMPNQQRDIPFRVVPVKPMSVEELVSLYSQAVERRDGEEKINSLLSLIDDRIRKVRITSAPDGIQLMFDFGLHEMLPVSQVGQGIHRLICIYSELLKGDAAVCVIDEIENGIHHSMLKQVWSGIGAAAAELDVQVFATTHSYECIEAAFESLGRHDTSSFNVIQLFRVPGGVKGRVLNSTEIATALEGGIDLR